MTSVNICVDDEVVAIVPLWMVKHAAEDAIAKYPSSKIVLEVVTL